MKSDHAGVRLFPVDPECESVYSAFLNKMVRVEAQKSHLAAQILIGTYEAPPYATVIQIFL